MDFKSQLYTGTGMNWLLISFVCGKSEPGMYLEIWKESYKMGLVNIIENLGNRW